MIFGAFLASAEQNDNQMEEVFDLLSIMEQVRGYKQVSSESWKIRPSTPNKNFRKLRAPWEASIVSSINLCTQSNTQKTTFFPYSNSNKTAKNRVNG